ncbi:hypothetical protein [Yoonia sp. BS5-3]|uniref:Uncharacterized protein n=1 Tax=Yoonia phaeophyticola TaxID=3137369 RepID=A0ABZ2V4E1_9RHOB
MRFFIVFICLIAAQPAHAGAWAREKGQLFIASGGNLLLSDGAELPVHYDPTLYVEYGLSHLMTVGIDYHTADQGRIDTGFAFARFPLGDTTRRDKVAASFALGARVDEYNPMERLMRGGLSWGRGLDRGWLAVDYTATYGDIDQVFRSKADFTWGHNLTDRWTTTLQLQTGEGFDDDIYAKISPSILFTINDRYRVGVGAVQALTGDRGSALKFDIWTTY